LPLDYLGKERSQHEHDRLKELDKQVQRRLSGIFD
jgi:hypothetical protein